MHLIDTHVHLLYPDRLSYAWCASQPALNRPFHVEDYRRAAAQAPAGVRIESAVFMEADVPETQQGAEVELFAGVANRANDNLPFTAMVAAAWPESPAFPAHIARLAREARICGVRRVLHTVPDGLSHSPLFAENLRLLPKYNLTFDLCLRPHLIPGAVTLATRCPETQFVVDHCGVPDIAAQELDPWRGDIRRIAALPNVVCKFSGLASVCDPRRPLTSQVRPFFEHCLECFSPQRLMWASDWPLCNLTFDLAAWLQTTAELLDELSGTEQSEICRDTARRIYRLA